MISVDELAAVKQRLDGKRLSPSAAGSFRQLELLFLVAHDEVCRMEKFESRARLVADKWELVKSARLLAAQKDVQRAPPLPEGFTSATPDDAFRCSAALDILFGPPQQAADADTSVVAVSTAGNAASDVPAAARTPPPAITAHLRKRPLHPAVYVDDEFTYEDDEMAAATNNNSSGFGTPSQSPNRRGTSALSSDAHQQQAQVGRSASGGSAASAAVAAPKPPAMLAAEQAFVDGLACCKFISALPLAAFQLAFHREGAYAATALAAALDELKLFEAQLRSSQESFVNLRACWNHELRALTRSSGVEDLFTAAHIAPSAGGAESDPDSDGAEDATERTTTRSAAARVDRLAAAETADGSAWQAPPLLPLRRGFTVSSENLFAGYAGPTLLGPVVGRHTIRDELSTMALRSVETEQRAARGTVECEAAFAFSEAMCARAVQGEVLLLEAVYARGAEQLRVLEMREELRRIKGELAHDGNRESLEKAASIIPSAAPLASAEPSPERAPDPMLEAEAASAAPAEAVWSP